MPAPTELPRDFPDKVIRQTLLHPHNLREFLARVLPEHVNGFDFTHVVPLTREFLSADWRGREADLLFVIPYHDPSGVEQDCMIEILTEHQSAPDPSTVLRSLLYASSSWESAWLEWVKSHGRGEDLRLRTIVCIVLLTGPGAWNAPRSLSELIAGPAELARFGPRLDPIFWELREQTADALLSGLGGWPKMLAVMRAGGSDAEEFERVFLAALRGLEDLAHTDRVRWLELVRAVMMWMVRLRPGDERPRLTNLAVASQNQVEDQREVGTMYETIYDAAVRQGQDLGRASALRSSIVRCVEKRLGDCPEAFRTGVSQLQDLSTLEGLFERVLDLKAPEDLTELIPPSANAVQAPNP